MKRIYIVEDNPDIGFILDLFLNEEGFEVSLFATAAEFKQAIKIRLPDLFLLDIMLPDGDGTLLCDHLKHNLCSLHIPVLLMSAHARIEQITRQSCADGFISKPFDLNVVLDRINKQLPAA